MCAAILDAYATLHERGVIHSDVHPRNVLVSAAGEVRIIDFGISHLAGDPPPPPPRAGVAFFFEPEYAQAVRSGHSHPAQTLHGEQYSVAALVYSLLCGQHYLDFSFDKEMLLRQIAEDNPLPFARRGAALPAALEAALLRALDKDPARRFATTRQFALAFRAALAPAPAAGTSVAANGESRLLLARVLDLMTEPARELHYNGPASPASSITYGAAGIALAAGRIACVRDDGSLLALADAWAERAALSRPNSFYAPEIEISAETVGCVSPFHTASGVAAVQALLATARGDSLNLDSALNRYLLHSGGDCSNPDLTLGQASVLLGLILLLEANAAPPPPSLLERGNQLYSQILDILQTEPAIGEPGKITYLGIAHGWAGLLYAALRWQNLAALSTPAIVHQRLRELAAQARFTQDGARWPVQATPGSISMSGWCNGSAGYVFLWTLAHRASSDPFYLNLSVKSAHDAFQGSGGGHGLCCGFAGQAYAQLCLYNHTADSFWLRNAQILAEKAAAFGNSIFQRNAESLSHSLYKGDTGVAVLIAELEKPETAAMPFFESQR
jgi:serine/threonine-protein kinase